MDINMQVAAVVVQLVGIAIGAVFIVRQIKASAETRREGDRDKLRLEIYKEIIQVRTQVTLAAINLNTLIMGMLSDLKYVNANSDKSYPKRFSERRAEIIFEENRNLREIVSSIVVLLEGYESVLSELSIFRQAFASKIYDIATPSRELFGLLVEVLPLDNPKVIYPVKLDEIEKLTGELSKIYFDISLFAHDLGVESQNFLLGGLYKNKVKRREPLDPESLVVRLDKYDDLVKYFTEDTEWGKRNEEAMAQAELEFGY